MKTIIFDVMGNDNGVEDGAKASMLFLKENQNYKITLVGDKKEIEKYLTDSTRIEIVNNPNSVNKSNEGIFESYKQDNSMNSALKLLKEEKGLAVLSSGDSGKYLASALMILKRIENVSRPAFMSIIPTIKENKKFLLLDEGANLNCNEEYLVQWAKLGAAFSRSVLKIQEPEVSILNIGTEDYKGYEYMQIANKQLSESKNLTFKYKGFIESRSLLHGDVDVVVADGFTGNITLKCLEGSILSFSKLIKTKLTATIGRKISALFLKKAFKEIKEHLDYRNVGAAWILGINGIVIKAHGSSDVKAYLGALNQIKLAIESNALEEFKKGLKE